MGQPPLRVLAEVTSTDFDGEPTERAEYGYPREGQKGKKPMGIGRRTAAAGEPLAVKGFSGKTADAVTVAEQIERLKHRFPLDAVVFGGDRGRVKATGKAALTAHRLKSIPTLTAPPGRNLLKQDVIQVDVVEEIAQAGEDGDRRLGRRRNEAVCRTAANRRRDQLVKLQPWVAAGNAQVQGSPRADPTVGRRRRRAWANRHHLCCFVTLTLEDRQLILGVDEEKQADAALLEGC